MKTNQSITIAGRSNKPKKKKDNPNRYYVIRAGTLEQVISSESSYYRICLKPYSIFRKFHKKTEKKGIRMSTSSGESNGRKRDLREETR